MGINLQFKKRSGLEARIKSQKSRTRTSELRLWHYQN